MDILSQLQTVHAKVAFDDLKIGRHELYVLMGYGEQIPNKPFLDMIDGIMPDIAPYILQQFIYLFKKNH